MEANGFMQVSLPTVDFCWEKEELQWILNME